MAHGSGRTGLFAGPGNKSPTATNVVGVVVAFVVVVRFLVAIRFSNY